MSFQHSVSHDLDNVTPDAHDYLNHFKIKHPKNL